MTAKNGAKVIARSSSFDHPQSRLEDFVRSRSTNHQVEVFLPRQRGVEWEVPATRSCTCGSFLAVRANLAAFLEDRILEVVSGAGSTFQALTVNCDLDRTNSAAISPDGTLHLRLQSEGYRRFGLVGRKSSLEPGLLADTYCIDVALKSANFLSKGSYYHRVVDCFQSRTQPVDLLCAAQEDSLHNLAVLLGASGLASFARLLPNEHVSCCTDAALPKLERLCRQGPGQQAPVAPSHLEHALDCLGRLSLGIEAEDSLGLGMHPVCLESHRWTGFIIPEQVLERINAAAKAVEDGRCPWAAVVVTGFIDTPVSWAGSEHAKGGRLGGENDYALLLLPDKQFVIFVLSGAGDEYRKS